MECETIAADGTGRTRSAPQSTVRGQLSRDPQNVLSGFLEDDLGDREEVSEIEVLDRHSASRLSTRWFCSMMDRIRV